MKSIAEGKFEPTWESLRQYKVPEWFRDAKFGIWAHWGPQCQPDKVIGMHETCNGKDHNNIIGIEHYGHPSGGFQDVIHSWKADKWDPEKLIALYKRAGAQYFIALANHHDNFDMWNSKYQEWNSVTIGPHKDILSGWSKAAIKYNLPF